MSDRQLSAPDIADVILACFKSQQPAFIWGPPGIGKSQLIAQIAEKMNGVMIDLRLGQMEPTDIRGIPFYNRDTGRMDWAPPIDLPHNDRPVLDPKLKASQSTIDAAAKATGKKPEDLILSDLPTVILFLDEMNTAPPSVQAASYQLILDRAIGNYVLPNNVVVVSAGNRETDKGVTFRMPTPLQNRLSHFEMSVNFDAWFEWAVNAGIHQDIVGFLNFSKGSLYDFDPKSSSRAFATPRSWEKVSKLLKENEGISPNTTMNLVAGTVGEGLAHSFMAHRKIASKMPKPTDILAGKVKNLDTREISAMYSLVISMCYEMRDAVDSKVKEKDFLKMANNFLRFMMNNFETEIVVMGARIALTQYKLPMMPVKLEAWSDFHEKYGKFIIAASKS